MPAPRWLALLVLGAACVASGCAPLLVGAAAVGGTAVALDRRPADVQLLDERIEWTASKQIGPKIGNQGHVNIASFNKQMLLTGETTTAALREEVQKIAASVPEARRIFNEIQVAPLASLAARSRDTYLTSSVKARFVGDQKFNPVHVKVVTEASVVYLMGLVTRKEADEATHIARHVSGVKRVVRLFEYLPDPPPQAPAPAAK